MRKEYSALINRLFTKARNEGVIQQPIQNETFNGRDVIVNGKKQLFWASCSYLGLETDERLKRASIDAVERYGTQLSASRAVIESGQYGELESLLGEIFGKPTLLAPTTSLGHISVIPIIVNELDALIMDQKVHNSVQNAILMARDEKIHVETLNHNRMDFLETRIQILLQKYNRVWYFLDGVYSMFGDLAPYDDLKYLLNKYPNFHIYVDDAHGLGWAGTNGAGTTIRDIGWHQNMILTTSLAKSFASCGGALVFDNEEQKSLIRNCGSSFIFSGPIQPAVLGASIAAAKIYLSDEIYTIQKDVNELITYFIDYANQLCIPLITSAHSPIVYIGVGKLEVGKKLMRFLMAQGHFATSMGFPAVQMNNSGIRVCITRNHTKADIKEFLDLVAEGLIMLLHEVDQDLTDVYDAFGITPLAVSNI